MSFSSRRRNYLLTPHRRDGLIEWMKSMLMHSFVLDALGTTGADTFSHFEMLVDEHISLSSAAADNTSTPPSRLKQLVPTVGTFHTRLPLRRAFVAYDSKYKVTNRRHVCISFNELRHILNLAQIMALRGSGGGADDDERDSDSEEEKIALERWKSSPSSLQSRKDVFADKPDTLHLSSAEDNATFSKKLANDNIRVSLKDDPFKGPKMITFDGDQTLYSDGANFESNPRLANYLYLLLHHGVTVAVVTAAGYEYQAAKYQLRLSGLLAFFEEKKLPKEDCERFYLFGGECNYLLNLGSDYKLHEVKEHGPGGWLTSTRHIADSPANWNESDIQSLLDVAETCMKASIVEQRLRGSVIRKKRAVGLIPNPDEQMSREGLDETVLRCQSELTQHAGVTLPFCAFNGGRDAWVDVGNKRVGVKILTSYLGTPAAETLHIGDQFLNTGNDYAARDVCPCVWITSPEETTYILKSILRLAGVALGGEEEGNMSNSALSLTSDSNKPTTSSSNAEFDFSELTRRTSAVNLMDVYTGEMFGSALPQGK